MPKQKDLKRIVRARMEKTGESYTAARLYLVRKKEIDFAALAGMSDASVRKATGRAWADWVKLLDAAGAVSKPHREIAKVVSSLGTSSWWSQMITVGYERIRGLRERGQQRSGTYSTSKSRTFNVAVEKLYKAFADARMRARWLTAVFDVLGATPNKTMRFAWNDGTRVVVGLFRKGDARCYVAIQHEKLPTKSDAEKMKAWWGERLAALAEVLG